MTVALDRLLRFFLTAPANGLGGVPTRRERDESMRGESMGLVFMGYHTSARR